jgi:polyisoprenoid-binding protein YceI
VADGAVTGVNVNIDTRSVWTDTGRLTGHLKSPDFFEVEAYPEATFEADRFESVDSTGATHLVTGNLSMHGQTHGVTFPATITVSGDTVMATADFIINRTDWAINYKGQADDLVEENVRLLLDIVAAPAGASAAPTGAAASE